jgi:hypothetical protein
LASAEGVVTAPQTMRDLQCRAAEKARRLPAPERYVWVAVWWHIEARSSANPSTQLGYARGQMRLAKDMAARPDHYRTKPSDRTDWQWSGLSAEAA